jgi:hypothetical protein
MYTAIKTARHRQRDGQARREHSASPSSSSPQGEAQRGIITDIVIKGSTNRSSTAMSKRQDRDEQATQEACEGTESALKLKAAQSCAAHQRVAGTEIYKYDF